MGYGEALVLVAAILMSSEPIFAAGFAIALRGELLTWRFACGAIVIAAMLLVEAGPRQGAEWPDPGDLRKLAR